MDPAPTSLTGLTPAEVRSRIAAGQVNAAPSRTSRRVVDIVRSNVLTWFNLVLGVLCAVVLVFGSWRDALFGLLLIINTAIGITQELRAKITLDRLSLISQPKVRAVRDGREQEIGASEVVLDDVIVLGAGDQIVADGTVLSTEGLEVDESALTGESVPVLKQVGDDVMSGSFAVAGRGDFRTTAVGAESYAIRIEAQGRRYVRTRSDIMDGINRVLKVIAVLLVPVGALSVWHGLRGGAPASDKVAEIVAPLVAMVPEGLVLLSSIAFAVSAVTLARRHVLVNQLPAVEGLARTDVVCADKTGTLTEPEPVYSRFELLDGAGSTEADGLEAIGALAVADASPNPTIRAIAARVQPPSDGWIPSASAAFSSARKWSGADFGEHGVWILGAPEVVLDCVQKQGKECERVAELAGQRLRVLVLARSSSSLTPETLPADLQPVGLVILAEQIRPDAAETIRYLGSQGVALKLISGDSPDTVSAVAAAAGVPNADAQVNARTLADDAAIASAVKRYTVFGRVTPQQKSAMVSALQREGHVVSMTGDGVNDVLALKQADLGIAMGSGVSATKAVADIVLLDNRFANFPLIVAEGRRVVGNAERVANLFLTKTSWAVLLAVAVVAAGLPYPFLPRQITLAGSLTIGIPAFFFALAANTSRYRPNFLPRVLRFAIPAGAATAVAVLAVFAGALRSGTPIEEARTLSTLSLVIVSLGGICVLEWPLSGWRLGVVAAMGVGMGVVFAVPFARDFFALVPVPVQSVAAAAAISAAAIAVEAANRRWGLGRGSANRAGALDG